MRLNRHRWRLRKTRSAQACIRSFGKTRYDACAWFVCRISVGPELLFLACLYERASFMAAHVRKVHLVIGFFCFHALRGFSILFVMALA